MPSRLEKTVLLTIAYLSIWFTITTFRLFQSIDLPQDDIMSTMMIHKEKPVLQRVHSRIKASVGQLNLPDLIQFPKNGLFHGEDNDNSISIPFPQSISNEERDFEDMIHPAMQLIPEKKKTKNAKYQHIQVPKFWDPPAFGDDIRNYLGNYGERLLTVDEALSIGSYTKMKADILTDASADSVEGWREKELLKTTDNNDKMEPAEKIRSLERKRKEVDKLETIFVAIASYRDYRCPHTVESIFARATYPERIRVGIVDQLDLTEDTHCAKPPISCSVNPNQLLCKYSNLIDIYQLNATLSVGPVFARHIGYRMYRGEYFAMQTDAHMEFINGWDVSIINQWKSTNNEMAVMTTYVSNVFDHYDKETGENTVSGRPCMCKSEFEEDYYENNIDMLVHGEQPEYDPLDKFEEDDPDKDLIGKPTLEPFWAAGFSFGRGHFVVQVPYDQYMPMVFQGEEINIGIRGFTYGYDFYAPERSVLFHYYSADIKKKKLKKVATFWENSKLYDGVESEAKARSAGILEMLTPKKVEYEDVEITEEVEEEEDGKADPKNEKEKVLRKYDELEIRSWYDVDAKKYGIGKVRSTKKFYDTFGIHLEEKRVEDHLCKFVGKPMNKIFFPFLRDNKMGIDYEKIGFEFRDPKKYKTSWTTEEIEDSVEENEENEESAD